MYLCELCGVAFDQPVTRSYIDRSVDCRATIYETLCPVCGEPYIEEADSCPGCDGFKFADERLCRKCRAGLLKKFRAFADELTAEEEEQLDDWLDGESIKDRGKWS